MNHSPMAAPANGARYWLVAESDAGEASTMTGGAPNVSTDNRAMVVGSYNIPYNVVSVDGPYYVFSY